MIILLTVLTIIVYLIPGYFVARRISSTDTGEVFAALMVIWPILLIGMIAEKILKSIGLYHPILKYLFIAIIIIAVIILFSIYSSSLFGN